MVGSGQVGLEIKTNSAQLKFEFWLSLATNMIIINAQASLQVIDMSIVSCHL